MTVAPLGAVKMTPIATVKPYPKNPRKIGQQAVEMVAKSLTEFGWQQPIVVDADHVIVVGHTRHLAARHLGLAQVPVVVARDLTPGQARAYRIADNRDSDYTSWDFPELTAQLEELSSEFADVLGLADWEGVLERFNEEAAGDAADLGLDLDPALSGSFSGKFTLNVVCESEEAARAASMSIIEMPGVIDVRDKL